MAGGNLHARSSNFEDNENDCNESLEHDFVNARVEPEGNHPIQVNSSSCCSYDDYGEKFKFRPLRGNL